MGGAAAARRRRSMERNDGMPMTTPSPVHHAVVLTHPDPDSFCASIARCWAEEVTAQHQKCEIMDLYREGFDPVLRKAEQPGKPGFAPPPELLEQSARLRGIDVLVLVYPIWFGSPPAMMKGYLERVIGIGTSFANGRHHGSPLGNVHLVDISTSASSDPWLTEKGIKGSLHTIFDRYIAEVFGAASSDRLHLDNVTNPMDRARGAFKLAQVREFAKRTCADAHARRWARS